MTPTVPEGWPPKGLERLLVDELKVIDEIGPGQPTTYKTYRNVIALFMDQTIEITTQEERIMIGRHRFWEARYRKGRFIYEQGVKDLTDHLETVKKGRDLEERVKQPDNVSVR